MNTTIQQNLANAYQKQVDVVNNYEFFEDAKRCDVCGSPEVVFSQRENGVVRNCLECRRYEESRL